MVMQLKRILPMLVLLIACSRPSNAPLEDVRMMMDTVVRIKVYEGPDSPAGIAAVMDSAFLLMGRLEEKISAYTDSSETALINRHAVHRAVTVSQELVELVEEGRKLSELTGGAFDISIGALLELWGFSSGRPQLPDPAAIEAVLPLVDFRRIDLDENRITLGKAGMRIDLGAIAKGYIVDRAVRFLKRRGVTAGLVEAGGDLRLFGKPPHRDLWRIGIRHPRNESGALFGILDIEAGSVTTSGDYERTFTQNGKRYHHLLDPATGYPANGCISVTVIAESAMLADAWATGVFILGPEKGMALLASHSGVEGMMIFEQDNGLTYRATPAFDEIFHLQE